MCLIRIKPSVQSPPPNASPLSGLINDRCEDGSEDDSVPTARVQYRNRSHSHSQSRRGSRSGRSHFNGRDSKEYYGGESGMRRGGSPRESHTTIVETIHIPPPPPPGAPEIIQSFPNPHHYIHSQHYDYDSPLSVNSSEWGGMSSEYGEKRWCANGGVERKMPFSHERGMGDVERVNYRQKRNSFGGSHTHHSYRGENTIITPARSMSTRSRRDRGGDTAGAGGGSASASSIARLPSQQRKRNSFRYVDPNSFSTTSIRHDDDNDDVLSLSRSHDFSPNQRSHGRRSHSRSRSHHGSLSGGGAATRRSGSVTYIHNPRHSYRSIRSSKDFSGGGGGGVSREKVVTVDRGYY